MTLKEKLCEPFGGLRTETADKLEQIADDYAIEFAEWKDNSQYVRLIDGNWVSLIIDVNTILTSKELLEIFKKEKEYGGV